MPDKSQKDPESTPPSDPQAGAPSTPAEPPKPAEPYRYPADYHLAWARGKTPDEVAAITEQLRTTALASSPAAPPTPTPSPAPSSPAIRNDVYSDPEGFVKSIEDYTSATIDSRVQGAAAPLMAPLAQMARSAAFSNPANKDIADAYGPEVDATMAALPLEHRMNPDTWNQAFDIVGGRHRKELAQAEAARIIANSADSGMLPSGGVSGRGASPPSMRSPIQELFASDDPSVEKFKEQGMGAAEVIAHAERMGYDEAGYVKVLQSNKSRKHMTRGTPRNS